MLIYRYAGKVYCENCGRDLVAGLTSFGEAPPEPLAVDQAVFPVPEVVESVDAHCAAGNLCTRASRNCQGVVVGRYLGTPSS